MRPMIAVLLCLVVVQSAKAVLVTEDFQAGVDPALPGFDSRFNHRIDLDEFGRNSGVNYSFRSSRFTSPGHSLFFGAGTDYITFNLSPGQYVDYAEVQMVSFQSNPPAYWHVIGTQGNLLQQTTESVLGGGTFAKFDTSLGNLGQIVEIRLTGYEGFFDDLKINIVPEPGTFCLLATGTTLVVRRGQKRGQKRCQERMPFS